MVLRLTPLPCKPPLTALKAAIFAILLLLSFTCNDASPKADGPCTVYVPQPTSSWTLMVYMAADNNLESQFPSDIEEMKNGFIDGQGVQLIVLIDRVKGYSADDTAFGADFSGIRLYRIGYGSAERICGGTEFPELSDGTDFEMDSGNPIVLKKFLQFCKTTFPAQRYLGTTPLERAALS